MFRISKVFIFWAIGLFLLSYIGSSAFPKISNSSLGAQSDKQDFNYYLSLAQWDGGNYIDIAKNGYYKQNYYAFSPAYPFLINFVSKSLRLDYVLSSLFISFLSCFMFIYFFYKYLRNLYSQNIAKDTIISFLFFPGAFYCLLIYSESLFLFLLALFLYSFSQNRYKTALIFLSLLPLVRFIGIYMIISATFKTFLKEKSFKLSAAVIAASLPTAVYLLIIYSIFKDPVYFVSTQSLWSRFILDPIATLFLYLVPLFSLKFISISNALDLTITLLFITLLIYGIKKIPAHLWIFSVFAILIPATTGSLVGMPRYALLSLGTFIIIADILNKHQTLKQIVWPASLALQCVLFSLFVAGHWIA